MKIIYNIYGNDFFVCECFASPSELNAPPLCQLFDGIYENANVGDGRPASRLVKSSLPALLFFILPPPYRWKPRNTRATEDSRLSVNYLTLLQVIDSYSLSRVSVNILTLCLPCAGLTRFVGSRYQSILHCLHLTTLCYASLRPFKSVGSVGSVGTAYKVARNSWRIILLIIYTSNF